MDRMESGDQVRHDDEDSTYSRGLETAIELAGRRTVEEFLDELRPVSPGLGRLVIETVFGKLHPRPALSTEQRELVTLAALATLGDTEKELLLHLDIAHRAGIPPASVIEVFVHVSAYVGFPRALNAVKVARDFYAERGELPIHDC